MRLARILDPKRTLVTRISKPALGLVGAFAVLCLVMLPNSPQVISFEQAGSQRGFSPAAVNQVSAAPAQPGFTTPSLLHRANFQTAARPTAVTSASFKLESKTSSPRQNHRSGSANPAAIVSARDPRPQEIAPQSEADDALVAAAYDSLLETDGSAQAQASQNIQPAFSTVVFVQETRFVEADSSGVWRVQVWRVVLVNPTWQHKVRIPAAHST